MNRRKFNALTMAALGATVFSFVPRAFGAPNLAKDESGNQTFRYRLRYARKGNTYWIWMRVSDTQNPATDVPVSLEFATDPGARNVVSRADHVSRSIDSHIVRRKLTIDSQSWQAGSPLYCALRIGNNKVSSKIYKVWKS